MVKTLPSTKMRATQRRKTTKKATKPRLKLQIVAVAASSCSPPKKDHKGDIDYAIGGGGPINPQSSCINGNKGKNNNYTLCKACI